MRVCYNRCWGQGVSWLGLPTMYLHGTLRGLLQAATTEPSWAVPLQPALLPPPPAGSSAHRARLWMQHLPDLAPHITLLLGGFRSCAVSSVRPAVGNLRFI